MRKFSLLIRGRDISAKPLFGKDEEEFEEYTGNIETQDYLSARREVGMQSMARQFSSSRSVFSLGHSLISGAIWLTYTSQFNVGS